MYYQVVKDVSKGRLSHTAGSKDLTTPHCVQLIYKNNYAGENIVFQQNSPASFYEFFS
jgi:hypothetical protein